MVTGSLLGLAVENGVLEITHAFPLPSEGKNHNASADTEDEAAGLEGHEFQLEMMRMLREVNVDNNCVGWYQSMYLGIHSTSTLLENQLNYQTELSPNAVVVLYDPMQTSHGNMVLKCFRLTDECIRIKEGDNAFINPSNIFEEIPVQLTNPGLVQALLVDIAEGSYVDPVTGESGLYDAAADTTFDRLDLSTNPYLEKHLEFMCGWVDDLAAEQHKFQYYSRQLARGNSDRYKNKRGPKKDPDEAGEGWASSDAPRRLESLLISNQLRGYCDQMDKFASGGLSKLFVSGALHKDK